MSTEKLWMEYRRNRDIDVRNELLIAYAPLVTRVVKALPHAYGCFTDENDMIGDGIFGLMDAIEKFNPAKNVKFESYASLRIRGTIIDKMRKMDLLSRNTRQKYKQIEEAVEQYQQENNQFPNNALIAEMTGMTEKTVGKTLEESTLANMLSLEAIVATGEKSIGMSQGENSPESEYQEKELIQRLAKAIDSLQEREQQLVQLYYYEELTLKEIGQVLDISESRTSQILSRTIMKLKQLLD
jgi:RNA polymerase sigma factor for flagellar operon FliA